MSKDQDRKGIRRRDVLMASGLGAVGLGFGGLSWKIGTGEVNFDLDQPWFGIPQSLNPEETASENASKLTSEDTATDGLDTDDLKDLSGRDITHEPGIEVPDENDIKEMNITPTEGRFLIPSVGMDVPLNSMNGHNDWITPPGYRSAYLLRNFGAGLGDPYSGRVYALMHSSRAGWPPGNYIVSGEGDFKVGAGTEVMVGETTYVVTSTEHVHKLDLPQGHRVWDNEPGTLAVITCRQTGERTTTYNSILYASIK